MLENKVVVFVGAGTPAGKVLVDRFAQAGATIIAIFATMDEAYENFPQHVEGWVLSADLAEESEATACFQKIGAQFGRIDVLVHMVQETERRPIERTSFEEWDRVIRQNMTTAFLSFRESVRQMQNGYGRLIALVGQQGADKARTQQAAYAASQAGIIRLVEATAAEYAKMDIGAFAVAQSILLTDQQGKHGVQASDVADLCIQLCTPAGKALSGAVLRAYGSII